MIDNSKFLSNHNSIQEKPQQSKLAFKASSTGASAADSNITGGEDKMETETKDAVKVEAGYSEADGIASKEQKARSYSPSNKQRKDNGKLENGNAYQLGYLDGLHVRS